MTFLAYFGHINLDTTIIVERIVSTGSESAISTEDRLGGTLGNFSMVASSLGLDFHPYTAVSRKTHGRYIELLRRRGVYTRSIDMVDDDSGPLCYIISDRRNQVAYVLQGPMLRWRPETSFPAEGYSYIHFSTGPPESYLKIARMATSAVKVFDPSQELFYKYNRESLRSIYDLSDIIMGNRNEMDYMSEMVGFDMERLSSNKRIIMTDGDRGAMLITNGQSRLIRGFRSEKVHDTVGAGDAFRAGFYASLFRGFSLENAISVGNFTASLAISDLIESFRYTWDRMYALYTASANGS